MTSSDKVRKLSSASLRIKIIVLLGIILVGFIFCQLYYGKTLTITNQETGEVYYEAKVTTGDKLTYKWIHSFEHIPWYEDFIMTGDNLLSLKEIRVAGFGAGIPEDKGVMTIEDGMVVMRELNQTFEDIRWFNSHTALEYIAINDDVVIHGSDMPHHEALILVVKGRDFPWEKIK